MSWQPSLYFISILVTFAVMGFLALYAWRQRKLTGASAFMWLALSECYLALAEALSMLSPTPARALFWFDTRFLSLASIPVLWLIFVLEYTGRKNWLSKRLVAGMFIIPIITQVMIWTNSLHGLWLKHNVDFHPSGPFLMANISARIPGAWFLVHSLYGYIFLLAGVVLMLSMAWHKARLYRGQAVLLAGGTLITVLTSFIPTFNLSPGAEFSLFGQSMGLSALLIALAVFRFQFLKIMPAAHADLKTKAKDLEEKRSLALFLFIFVLLVTGIATAAALYYRNYEQQYRSQVERQISAIAELKVNELVRWRQERLGDATVLYKNPAFSNLAARYLENPQDAEAQGLIQTWLESYLAYVQYDQMRLLDTQGITRLSDPTVAPPVSAAVARRIPEALQSGQVTLVDFYRSDQDQRIYLTLLVPILNSQPGNRAIGLVALRMDPNVYLYPYLSQWPAPSTTAETLLIRRDGNDALFLNELKFRKNTALNLRIPLESKDVPAVKAALGQTGMVEGVDYRGVPVIADVRAVPDSPWFLVARMDTAEVYAPLRSRLWQVVIFFGALIAATGAGLVLVWRQQRLRYYRAQVQAAEALHESEARLRALLTNAPVVLFAVDNAGVVTFADGRGLAALGLTPEQVIRRRANDFFPEQTLIREGIQRALTGEKFATTGQVAGLWFDVRLTSLPSPDGQVVGAIGVAMDITERKQVEEALRESEERYRLLTETTQDLIYVIDRDDRVEYVNAAAARALGTPSQNVIGKGHTDLFPPEIAEGHWRSLQKVFESGEPFSTESHIIYPHGEMWISTQLAPFRREGGKATAVMGVSRDITERKQAEEALRETNEYLENLFNYANAPIIVWDPQFKVTRFNHAFETLTGRSAVEVLGKSLEILFPPAQIETSMKLIQKTLSGERWEVVEINLQHVDGSVRTVLWNSATLFSADGKIPIATIAQGQDITERKRAEAALRESEARYRAVTLSANDAIITIDGAGIIAGWNRGAETIFGYTEAEASGQPLTWLLPSRYHDGHLAGLARVQAGGEQHVLGKTVELDGRRKDGSEFPLELSLAEWQVADGRFYTAIIRDITERKRVGAALRVKDWAIESAINAIAISDLAGNLNYVNPAFLKLWGYSSPAEVLGKSATGFWQMGEKAAEVIEALRAQGGWMGELVARGKDGAPFDVQVAASLVVNSAGQPICMLAWFVDITERKRAEEALRESEQKLTTLFELLPVGVSVLDAKSQIAYVNPALEKILDISREGLLRGDYRKRTYLRPDGARMSADEFASVRAAREQSAVYNVETGVVKEDGQVVWTNVSAVPVAFSDWRGVIVTADITERKQLEVALAEERDSLAQRVEERTQELSLANLDLARAVRLRDEFLANMSHELHTPLNGILGLSESLQEGVYGPLTPKQMHSLQTIESSGQRLLALVSDILDFAKIGAGKLDVRMGPVSVKSVCQASLRYAEQIAQKKHLTLTSQLDEQVESLQADPRRLKQILVNLLANAVKFTPEGGTVGLEVVGDAERGEARFTVWDTGIGIAPEDIARLFQPFIQLDTGLARHYEGAGLGLALVARLVELHSGRVWAESEPGKGSRFTVAIPWQAVGQETRASGQVDQEQADAEPPRPVSLRPAVKILLAEDNPMAFEVVAEYLTEKGYHVIAAGNGAEALERARQEKPALILMDAQMPVMDGLEATRRLRADAELKHIPVIALTGLAMEGDEARCLAAGANDYLTKPVSLKKLMGMIEAQLSGR